eukprot:Skav201766  [mRNA]  locus=scaffold1973:479189:481571:- [translate_table: standard]
MAAPGSSTGATLVDAWPTAAARGVFGAAAAPVLFGRAFVPINEAKYHRRSCTWPMIDAQGQDVAYLTCEFSFARIPQPVQDLVARAAGNEVHLTTASNEDRVVPIKGYRVDSRCLGRGRRSSAAGSWQHEGDVDARAAPRFQIQGLKPDTIYLLRDPRGVPQAVPGPTQGEAEDVEVKTGPCAPAGCGVPRLAGCHGPVLAVEWDPPVYDGGAELVADRVWVRPFSTTEADASDMAGGGWAMGWLGGHGMGW